MSSPSSSENFQIEAYKAHHELFRHYSSLLFRSRLSLMAVVLVFFAYLFNAKPIQETLVSNVMGVPNRSFVAYAAAVIIVLLFSLETTFVRRLAETARAAARLEEQARMPLYFSGYETRLHKQLLATYVLSVLGLLVLFCAPVFPPSRQNWPQLAGYLGVALIPLLLFAFAVGQHWRKLNDMTGRSARK